MRVTHSRSVFWTTLAFYSVVILTEKGFGEYEA